MTSATRVAVFLPSLFGGGAERMMLKVAAGFARQGLATDLVLAQSTGAYVEEIPPGVRVLDLESASVLGSLPKLARYLKREQPVALLSTLNTANVVAVLAKRLAKTPTRVVVRQANMLEPAARVDRRVTRWVIMRLVQWTYPRADAVIAVSDGVARDVAEATKVPRERLHVVPNPVVDAKLLERAKEPPDHPWFRNGSNPIVLGVGRLTPQKDFSTLLRAFAEVRQRHDARLVILGEGPERGALEALTRELDIEAFVSLPGFVQNPFSVMARARLFVLSSAWEGLPGVLIQALACGAPVVATDCESGPREILDDGRFGRLIPVGDPSCMAKAILDALDTPPGPPKREAWARFTDDAAVDGYLHVLGITPPSSGGSKDTAC